MGFHYILNPPRTNVLQDCKSVCTLREINVNHKRLCPKHKPGVSRAHLTEEMRESRKITV